MGSVLHLRPKVHTVYVGRPTVGNYRAHLSAVLPMSALKVSAVESLPLYL